MKDETAQLGELVLVQGIVQRQFLSILVSQLIASNTGFNADAFLTALYVYQEHLPMPDGGNDHEYNRQCEIGMSEWRKLTEMAEQAVKDGEHWRAQ